ncbi:MAG: alpha/beta fold hydrolase, partial [Candidatus Thorarchaeota archaeon]
LGEITVEEMSLTTTNGRRVVFSVYKPRNPDYGQPLPAVLTLHGVSGSRYAMDAYNIELARRNFTVVALDTAGHGLSGERFRFSDFNEIIEDAYEAIRYVQLTDAQTDNDTYGVLGHSLGAGIALLFDSKSVLPQSTVIIGGGIGETFEGLALPTNETYPRNLLIALGNYDELVSSDSALDTLRIATGTSDAAVGTVYGDFTNGTARKMVLSNTNHLFEISDSALVTESVGWLVRSIQGGSQYENHTLSPSDHIYQYKALGTMIGSASLILSLFPLFLISYENLPKRFRPVRQSHRSSVVSPKTGFKASILMSTVSSVLLLVAMFSGLGMEFAGLGLIPISFGTSLVLFSFVSFFFNMALIKRFLNPEVETVPITTWPREVSRVLQDGLKSVILLLPVLVWLVFWSIVSAEFAGVRLGFTFPAAGDAVALRLAWLPILTALFVPLFYSEKIWLNESAGTGSEWRSYRTLIQRAVLAVSNRLVGLLILLAALYGPFFLGLQLGLMMFVALILLPFTMIFGITACISLWIGGIAKSDMSAAILNALIVAAVVTLSFQIV